jgi:hypothetical protein
MAALAVAFGAGADAVVVAAGISVRSQALNAKAAKITVIERIGRIGHLRARSGRQARRPDNSNPAARESEHASPNLSPFARRSRAAGRRPT